MDTRQEIIKKLQKLTSHSFIEILERGNQAIWSALHAVKKEVLVPQEGGWLTYLQYPKRLKLTLTKIKTKDAVIDLADLTQKSQTADAFLYQNPGGYHAEQPLKEIHQLCQKNNCLTLLDASGSLGTPLCQGNCADIIIGSFGQGKLIDAGFGGFLSCRNQAIFDQIKPFFKPLTEEKKLKIILKKINALPQRIDFLLKRREKIIKDLKKFSFLHPSHLGFVLIVKFKDEEEKNRLIFYCRQNSLPFTLCPRYIRLNQPALSIEVKQLSL